MQHKHLLRYRAEIQYDALSSIDIALELACVSRISLPSQGSSADSLWHKRKQLLQSPEHGHYNSDCRRSKSFEEREEEYEKARRRIFTKSCDVSTSFSFSVSPPPLPCSSHSLALVLCPAYRFLSLFLAPVEHDPMSLSLSLCAYSRLVVVGFCWMFA